MVDPEQVKNRGIQIVDVNCVVFEFRRALTILINDVVAVFVGSTMLDTPLDPPACQPSSKAARVMVATVVGVGLLALTVHGPSEFTGADDEGVLQQPSLLQILY